MRKRKETRKWLILFYSAEGQLKDGIERFCKLKPTAWANRRIAEDETVKIVPLD